MNVLIAGFGYLGRRLAARLAAEGNVVYGLRRQPEDSTPEVGVELIAADVTQPDTLEAIPAGLDHVVYMVSAGRREEEAYRKAYVIGVGNLIEWLHRRSESMKRMLFVSSTGVYEPTDGSWIDETTSVEPRSFTGQSLLQGEALVEDAAWPSTVLRLSGIYGPGRALFVDTIRSSPRSYAVEAGRYVNLIHVDDAAGAIAHLLTRENESQSATYLGVDHEPVEKRALFRWLCRELGAPEPIFEPDDSASTGRRRANKRCRNDRLLASGYRFRYPTFREGYRRILSGSAGSAVV